MAWETDAKTCFGGKFSVDPKSGCWVWAGAPLKRGGYGAFVHRPTGMIMVRAHRAAWRLYVGPIPDGMGVLHRCDNRLCVNPDHLFLGDQASNMLDKVAKRRQNRGETHGRHKLKEHDAAFIRSSVLRGVDLARQFNVSQATIRDIRSGRSWAHLGESGRL